MIFLFVYLVATFEIREAPFGVVYMQPQNLLKKTKLYPISVYASNIFAELRRFSCKGVSFVWEPM